MRTIDPIRRGLRRLGRFRLMDYILVRTIDPIRRGLRRLELLPGFTKTVLCVRTIDPIRRGLRLSYKIFH